MLEQSDVISYAQKMQTNGNDRNIAFDAYRQMYLSGWDLPDAVKQVEWVQKVISADCYDAIQTGMRILATIPLSVKYQPLAPGQANKERAGRIESVLKWNLMSANRRRSRSIEAEVVKNALLYDMVAIQVVDLEYEVKEKKKLRLDATREEEALARGRFMLIPYDSRSVFFEWSNLMLERVLTVQHMHASEVVDNWGELATQHKDLVDLAKKPFGEDWVTVYDYFDHKTRMTWVAQGKQFTMTVSGEGTARWVLNHGTNPQGFIPFAVRGGTQLETSGAHKYQPLLYPVYATGAWDIKNIVSSLMVSEVVAHTGSPRLVEEGPSNQQAQVNMMSPERHVKMPPGNSLKQIQPATIDAALTNVEALLSAQIHKSTISEVLQGGDVQAGTAFATLNLMTQTAVGVLKPFKHLAELVLSDMFVLMMKWVDFTEIDLYGYGTGRADSGQEYEIVANEIDIPSVYISVELHPDTPTDKQQKINAAVQAVQGLNMSEETGLEEIGIEDPQAEIKRRIGEKIFEHEMQLEFDRERMEMEAEIQVQTQAAIMGLQQMAMQAQQQQQPPPQQEGPPMPMPGGPMGGPPMGGPPGVGPEEPMFGPGGSPIMNPAEGAPPPGMFAPEDNAEGAGLPMAPEGGGELL